MKRIDLNTILKDKTKDELFTLARKYGISGYSKKSKGALILHITSNIDAKSLKKEVGLAPPFYQNKRFWSFVRWISPIILTLIIFFIQKESADKDNEAAEKGQKVILNSVNDKISELEEGQNGINNQLLEINKKIKTDKDYDELISKYEKLNIILLHDFYGENFQVYGQKEGHLYKNAKIYNSIINISEESIEIIIDRAEFSYVGAQNNTLSHYYEKIMLNQAIKSGDKIRLGFSIKYKSLWLTILDEDPNHPVFAIGTKKD